MTVTPDGQQRRVDPGPGRGIHLPAAELVSFRTGTDDRPDEDFILRQTETDRLDGPHDDSSKPLRCGTSPPDAFITAPPPLNTRLSDQGRKHR